MRRGQIRCGGVSTYKSFRNILVPGITNSGDRNYRYELIKIRSLVERSIERFKGKFKRYHYENINGQSLKKIKEMAGSVIIHNLIIFFHKFFIFKLLIFFFLNYHFINFS